MNILRTSFLALLLAGSSLTGMADDRVVEMRADRVFIYPQRMELTGEESVMDILMMYPDVMAAGFDEVATDYSVRIDNSNVNVNTRVFLNQLKAKYVSKIQVCDNTGVAKGTVGMNRVIDINLLRMEEGANGNVGAGVGTDRTAEGKAELLYGSKKTDVYAIGDYTYQDIDDNITQKEQLFAHMTNWFSPRDRLLTYFNQHYTDSRTYLADGKDKTTALRYHGRARYFHNFNDKGTELLLVGAYQYTKTPKETAYTDYERNYTDCQDYLLGIVELNTPLGRNLSMMAGWEGNFTTDYLHLENSAHQEYYQSNNDLYLQYNLRLKNWLFTLGDRVMFYHYGANGLSHNDTRNNIEASIVATLSKTSQAQLAYHRKFSNPSYGFKDKITTSAWLTKQESLYAQYIDELKLSYNYSRKNFTWSAASYLVQRQEQANMWKLQSSAYYKTGILAVTAGANYYNIKGADNDYAVFHIAPRLSLPYQWQVGVKGIFTTDNAELVHNEYCYLDLSVGKVFGKHFAINLDWHDISSKSYSGCLASLEYRF